MNSSGACGPKRTILALALMVLIATLGWTGGSGESSDSPQDAVDETTQGSVPADEGLANAVLAGGCFWCMEEAFEKVQGVSEVVSGYAGGLVSNPRYSDVVRGGTGHTEVVRIFYNPEVISYEEILYVFWRNVDLTDGFGQFCDRGASYRPEIFYETEEQRVIAESSRQEIIDSGRFPQVAVPVSPLDLIDADTNDGFWIAEEYHQDYYLTNSLRYTLYKEACGRVRRLVQLWGDEAGAPNYQIEKG